MLPYLEKKRVINIVDSIEVVNTGIWTSAISTSAILKDFGIKTELWFPKKELPNFNFESIDPVPLNSVAKSCITELIITRKLDRNEDVIVTHGCWKYCTVWGNEFAKRGFNWIYVPHGMLEPWALRQKQIKKFLYLGLKEKRLVRKASVIRAVSSVESDSLKRIFPDSDIAVIPNGVKEQSSSVGPADGIIQYLFLGRLHKKKGIIPLIKGWQKSSLNNNARFRLIIAGPDDGELAAVEQLIRSSANIFYKGPVFGDEKTNLFQQSAFYILPSFSEGFPGSVLEAMSFGLICLISEGCNLTDAFNRNIALRTEPTPDHIFRSLELSSVIPEADYKTLSENTVNFVKENFSLNRVADLQLRLYNNLSKLISHVHPRP